MFFPSHLLSSPFCSLSHLVVTQVRGLIAGSSPPLPTTVRALHFYREKISSLASLVDSRRIVLTHARRSQKLVPLMLGSFSAEIDCPASATPYPLSQNASQDDEQSCVCQKKISPSRHVPHMRKQVFTVCLSCLDTWQCI